MDKKWNKMKEMSAFSIVHEREMISTVNVLGVEVV